MKKQVWTALIFLVVIAVIAVIIAEYAPAVQLTQAPAVPVPAEASNTTPLLFLGNQNIAPVVYLDGTTPLGIDVDIVHALAQHMSQPVEIRAMNWSEAQTLVAQGDADALIQINPTEERKKIYDFSDPLLESHFSIFTRSDTMGISGLSDLRGLRVGVELGGLPQNLLQSYPQVQLIIIPNFTEGFRQLNEGSVDAVVVDYRVGSYILAQNNIQNIKVTGEPIASSYSAFAVKKGNTKLLNDINNALQIIKADGTYQKIIDKWQPAEAVFETQQQITERNYVIIIVVLLILFLIAIVWMVTAKKELTKRKAAEEKLKENYSTLLGIIDSADALIFSVDRHYRYTSFNQGHAVTMKAIYGAEIEPGHSILEYMTVAEDRETARHNLDRALAGEHLVEEAYSGEELRSRKYFRVSHSPIMIQEKVIGVAVLAQDMTGRKRAETELARVNRALRMLSSSNQALVHIPDETTLMNEICRIAVEVGGYRLAWIGFAEQDEAKTIRPVAHAGFESGYLESAKVNWADSERGRGPGGTAIRTGQPSVARYISVDPAFAPWRAEAMRRGYQSIIALPLTSEGRTFGALGIYASEADAFDTEEVKILTELADDLAFGLTALRTCAKREQAEEALQVSEAQYRSLIETTGTGYVILDKDGQVQTANQEYVRLTGRSTLADIEGKPVTRWTASYDIERNRREVEQCLEKGMVRGLEIDYRKPDGAIQPVEINASVVDSGSGPIILTLVRDITERKRAEDALKESEKFLNNVVENIPDMIFVKDAKDLRFVRFNKAGEDLLGFSREELYGKNDYDFFPKDEADFFIRKDREVLENRQLVDIPEEMIQTRLKGGRILHTKKIPIIDESGKPGYLMGISEDITERKRAEDALRKSGREWQTTFNAITDAIFLLDGRGKIIRHNHAFETFTGKPADEIDGKYCHEVMHGTASPVEWCPNMKAQKSRQRESIELKIGNRWFIIAVDPIFSEDSTFSGAVHLLIDITERKLAEVALNQASKKLNLLNAITFSDIQNSIFSLSGYFELEMLMPMDEKLRQYRESEKKIVQNIAESLKFTTIYQSLGIKPLEWQNVQQSFLLGISHLNISSLSRRLEVSGVEIYADPLLENVFFELAENVIMHGRTATELTLRYQESSDGLILFFEDNGTGIPDELKEKIFERGYGRRKGLGLFLTREILSITGITIRETGEAGTGARFEILVPKESYRFTTMP